MENRNNQEHDPKQESLGFRILVYFLCVVINIAVTIFMIISKFIIIILWPFVRLSLILEHLNLKLKKAILEEKIKKLSEAENDSST